MESDPFEEAGILEKKKQKNTKAQKLSLQSVEKEKEREGLLTAQAEEENQKGKPVPLPYVLIARQDSWQETLLFSYFQGFDTFLYMAINNTE